jgi:exodeoxyribonuclease VII small subunit
MPEEETPASPGQDAAEAPGYEQSFARVEELVRELESGELSLKESIRKYEEAIKSMNRCYEMLDDAQKKIEILLKDAEGRLSRQDFEAE